MYFQKHRFSKKGYKLALVNKSCLKTSAFHTTALHRCAFRLTQHFLTFPPDSKSVDQSHYAFLLFSLFVAESEAGMVTVNRCLDAAKACNVDDTCQKLRTEYVSACITPSARAGPCNRLRCSKALRKFFDRVPPDYTHELLFCPCSDTACAERRRQTIVPSCSFEEREKLNCLVQLSSCEEDLVCK